MKGFMDNMKPGIYITSRRPNAETRCILSEKWYSNERIKIDWGSQRVTGEDQH